MTTLSTLLQTPLEQFFLKELTEVAKSCYHRGWSYGTAGNFSLRSVSRDFFWQSPSALCKGDLDSRFFIPVSLETGKSLDPIGAKVSEEMPLHLAIYRKVRRAQCVVHSHPPYLNKLTRNHNRLTFKNEEMQKCLGSKTHAETLELKVHENIPSMQDLDLRSLVDETKNVVILKLHGVYAWGETPKQALAYLEALEYLALTS